MVSNRPRIVPAAVRASRPTAFEELITCAGARHTHRHPTPLVYLRCLSHAAQEQWLPLPRRANAALSWVRNRSLDTAALPRHQLAGALSHIIVPATRMCGSRQRRPRQQIFLAPGRPQGGTPPSLRPRTSLCHQPVPSTTPTDAAQKSIASAGSSRRGTTAAVVATISRVAVPELPNRVPTPALDAPVVLRSAASLMHPEDGAGGLQRGFLQTPNCSPNVSAEMRTSCLESYGF